MKWLGQYIQDLPARFRDDVYLESISTGTIASGAHLGLDSDGKIVKATDGGGTVTSIATAGTENGLTLTGGAITSSGTITLGGTLAINNSDWSGTDLSVANGGTGASTLTDNSVLTGTGTSAITAESNLTFDGTVLDITNATANRPIVNITNTSTSQQEGGNLIFRNADTNTNLGDNIVIGDLVFQGWNFTGSDYESAALIRARKDGATGGDNDMGGELAFYTTPDGSATLAQRMCILNDGNIGIGTTSPDAPLNIEYTTGAMSAQTHGLIISGDAASDTAGHSASMLLGSIAGVSRGCIIAAENEGGGGDNRHNLVFMTSDSSSSPSEAMRIDHDGNVGIGTTSPLANLHIRGDSSDTDHPTLLFLGDPQHNGVGGYIGCIWEGSDPGYQFLSMGSSYYNGTNWITNDNTAWGSNNVSQMVMDDQAIRFFVKDSTGNTTRTDSAATFDAYEAMRIDNTSGNVGIGTASPGDDVHIAGSDDSDATLLMTSYDTDTSGNYPTLKLFRARGTQASPSIVVDGDRIGGIWFGGWLGSNGSHYTNYSVGASISAIVDGDPTNGSEDIPTALTFSTSPSGSTGNTERMRISPNGDLSVMSDTVTFSSASADDPTVIIKNTHDGTSNMARLQMKKERASTFASGDNVGEIEFIGEDASDNPDQVYGKILVEADVTTHGEESGKMSFGVANEDGGVGYGLILTGGSENNEVDVIVGYGVNSQTHISGTAVIGGGYSSTGINLTTAGVGSFAGALTTDGLLTADSLNITGAAPNVATHSSLLVSISANDSVVRVTSGGSNYTLSLPPPIIGKKIRLIVAESFELRSSAPATIAINGGTGSGSATAESQCSANTIVECTCFSATAWVCTQTTLAGVQSAIPAAA